MKSSLFVTLGSVFFLSWLVASYVTTLQPEPRLGKGSLPLSAQHKAEKSEPESAKAQPMVAKSDEAKESF
jgi:hypothetical protein